MPPDFSHPDSALLAALARAALAEVKARRQLLGWWLPAAAGVALAAVGVLVGASWPFWVVVFGMLFSFHRYHRWKLQLAFATTPQWCFGTLGDTREVSRGHRQSHGLMYPVHLKRFVRWSAFAPQVSSGVTADFMFWVDGGVLSQLQEGQFVGLLQVGEESVVAACRDEQVFVSDALRFDHDAMSKMPRVP